MMMLASSHDIAPFFFQDVHVPSHFLVARRMNSVCLDLPVAGSGCSKGFAGCFPKACCYHFLATAALYLLFLVLLEPSLPSIPFQMSFVSQIASGAGMLNML